MTKAPFFAVLVCALSLALFSSCSSSIKVKTSGSKTTVSFSAEGGEAFLKTISMLDGTNEQGNGASGDDSLFSTEDICANFMAAGFKEVSASTIGKKGFSVTFTIPESKKDPLSESGILKFSEEKKPYFELSKEKFENFYELIPFELKSYIDLFMAPSFTQEIMDDEEYLDLVASVFGPTLSKEIKEAKIQFEFEENGKVSKKAFSLLSILNLEGKLFIGK